MTPSATVLTDVITALMTIIYNAVSFITQPVVDLINASFPQLTQALAAVSTFIDIAMSALGWVISLAGIPLIALTMIGLLYTAKLTIPLLANVLKLGLKWWKAIIP